jgi:hypothetical protein
LESTLLSSGDIGGAGVVDAAGVVMARGAGWVLLQSPLVGWGSAVAEESRMPVGGAVVIEGESSALMVVVAGRDDPVAEELLGAAGGTMAERVAFAWDCVFSTAGVFRLLFMIL